MIYTVTFNPAIDYVVHVDKMALGKLNRSAAEQMYIGGKGINVSIVLARLGVPSRALGFVAGFTGKAIEDGAAEAGIETDFVHLESGCSRINLKIKAAEETEVNGQGPRIPESALTQLFTKLGQLQDGDTLVLAGSIPASLPGDMYEQILARLAGKRIRAVVDAAGELLLNVIKYKPFLIKPNDQELGELFGTELKTEAEIIARAQKLQEMGAVNVLVSMAHRGAVLLDERGAVHRCGVCKGQVRNSVGAGDSMVAGFLAGLESGGPEYALKLGTAAGGATAFAEGLAERDMIYELLKHDIYTRKGDSPHEYR